MSCTCVCATRHAPQTLRQVEQRRVPLCARRTRDTLPAFSFSSRPFPLASHLIASSLSSLRRHPDHFALPHCVTIRGTELISTLFRHRGLPTVTRNTVHVLRLRETKKSSPEFPSRRTLSPLRRCKINKPTIVVTRTQND